jgi:predicted GNAT family acetyltransferase
MHMDAKVVDVPEKGRFEVRLDDRVVGLASYHIDGTTMTLPHTEVDPSMGGRGIGTALVAGVLEAARERGLHVLPYCSFIRHYIQQHPETVDLVADEDRPHFGLETADR